MPAISATSGGTNSLEERIRRKIEHENSGQAAKSNNERNESKEKTSTSKRTSRRPAGLSSSMIENGTNSFEERIRRKIEQESNQQAARSNNERNESEKTSTSRISSSRRPNGLSSSMPPVDSLRSAREDNYEERIRRKMESDKKGRVSDVKGSAEDSFNERLRRKMESEKNPRVSEVKGSAQKSFDERLQRKLDSNKNEGGSSTNSSSGSAFDERLRRKLENEKPIRSDSRVSVSESFEERLQHKMETEKNGQSGQKKSKNNTQEGAPARPKLRVLPNASSDTSPGDSDEVDNLRRMLLHKRSARLQRPLGLSSSLPINSVQNLEALEEDGNYDEGNKVDLDKLLQQKNEAGLSLDEKIKLKRKNLKKEKSLQKEMTTNFSTNRSDDDAYSNEEFNARMTKRSVRAGLTRTNASRDVEDNGRIPDQDRKEELKNVESLPSSRRTSLVREDSFQLEGLKEDALLEKPKVESWNELEDILATTKKESARAIFGGAMLDSWSELGDVLELTKQSSAMDLNPTFSSGSKSKPSSRRASDAQCWVCTSCTYRNLDGRSIFCETCGDSRF